MMSMNAPKLIYRIVPSILLAALLAGNGWFSLSRAAAPSGPARETLEDPADGYGYIVNVVSEEWVEANSGVLVNSTPADDAFYGPFPLGFSFRFYENTFTHFYVSTNGLVTFGSGSIAHVAQPIPFPPLPNNLVAAYWTDWHENNFKIYYKNVGTAYTVIEWEVFGPGNVLKANYEVILYASGGDIVFQHANLNTVPTTPYAVGIEDADGVNGLAYTSPLVVGQDLRFIRPLASPRVNLKPRFQGGFTSVGEALFNLQVINNGEIGSDRYNLTVAPSDPTWQVSFLNGTNGMPLTDTTSDGIVDTGPVALGQSTIVVVKIKAPYSAPIGSHASFVVTATSTQAPTKFMTTTIQTAVPTQFAQVFSDVQGVHLAQIWEENYIDREISRHFSGASMSMEGLPQGNYMAAWEVTGSMGLAQADSDVPVITHENYLDYMDHPEILSAPQADRFTDIKYRMSSSTGGPGLENTLTTGAADVLLPNIFESNAYVPTIAGAPDGKIAIAWTHLKSRQNGAQYEDNSNIYFAVLNSGGSLISSRYDVTNDAGWYPWVPVHQYENPNILVTPDGKYVVCWVEGFALRIRCGYHALNNGVISPLGLVTVDTLPSNKYPQDLSMIDLPKPVNGNRFMVLYSESDNDSSAYNIVFSVWGSDQLQVKGRTVLAGANGWQPRAVQFITGETLVTWVEHDGRLGYAYLDENYNLVPGYPQFFERVNRRGASSPSVTLDQAGQAVITYLDADVGDSIFYALISPQREVLTPPVVFISDRNGDPEFNTSAYGHGNAGYAGVFQSFLPITKK